ncbi:hypothetical protein SDC9_187050 [bioreactor metagenome]|uniref:Uncharacterized protein n=1 Tax=bioreactor metagenome TaxID=1076179 RepID=A0A645HM48_9ZZZZ
MRKLPYRYSYRFTTADGKEHTMMIEDWEVGVLYWNCLMSCDGNRDAANIKVRDKYMKMAKNKNIFFFIGTSRSKQFIAKNPFIIVGVVSPENIDIRHQQGELF